MATEMNSKDHVQRAIDVAIHIGLLALLTTACLLILLPFLPLVAWGIIIAIAVFPAYRKFRTLLGERGNLAAVLGTLLFLAVLIVPVALLTGTTMDGVQTLAAHIKDGSLSVPPPPAGVATWPLVGPSIYRTWTLASTNLTELFKSFAPQIKAFVPALLAATAGLGLTVLQFVLSILLAGFLLAKATSFVKIASSLFNRLFGNQGAEYQELAASTIRSVTNGILGVALIQSVLAALGFLVAGLPGAGLWTVIFLFAAVLQVGIVGLVPPVIYMFTIANTTKAVLFLVWCAFVGLIDNVLKPILLGRGVSVPTAVVFLGAIGGFVAMGSIGLFVGAIILSVGYKLFLAWLAGPEVAKQGIA